jgi:hypothetical protein
MQVRFESRGRRSHERRLAAHSLLVSSSLWFKSSGFVLGSSGVEPLSVESFAGVDQTEVEGGIELT